VINSIKAWPKLYQNLRATRQTELLAQFPAKDVCDWLGNSQAVAMKHYAMPTDDSLQRAICGSTCGSISANQEVSGENASNEKFPENSVSEGSGELVIASPVGPAGLELLPETPGNSQSSPDVVLRVVLSELQKLNSEGQRQVVSQLQTLTGLTASPPSQPSPPYEK
jgi:hypothetical protein